jgi:hypothetical protein
MNKVRISTDKSKVQDGWDTDHLGIKKHTLSSRKQASKRRGGREEVVEHIPDMTDMGSACHI